MNNLKRRSLTCFIILICLAVCSCKSHMQSPEAPKGEVAPAIKSQVENALGSLGKEISGKAPSDDKSAFAILKSYLGKNSYIYGAAFAFAPANKNGSPIKSSPYVHRKGENLIEKNLIDSYDYSVQDWYVLPVREKKPLWSEPYYDKGGGEAWMITYSIPVYSDEKQSRLIGVITSDLLVPNK